MICRAPATGGQGGTLATDSLTDTSQDRVLVHLWPTQQPEVFETNPADVGGITTIGVTFDGGSSVLAVSKTADLWVPFACTIGEVRMLSKEMGSVRIGVWKTPYTSFPASSAQSITASATPAIVSSNKYADAALSGWTTLINKDDTLRFNIDSIATIKQVVLQLKVTRMGTGSVAVAAQTTPA